MTRDEAREDDDRDTSGIDDPFAELGEGVDNADHRGDERDDSVSTHDGESDPDVGSDPDTESGQIPDPARMPSLTRRCSTQKRGVRRPETTRLRPDRRVRPHRRPNPRRASIPSMSSKRQTGPKTLRTPSSGWTSPARPTRTSGSRSMRISVTQTPARSIPIPALEQRIRGSRRPNRSTGTPTGRNTSSTSGRTVNSARIFRSAGCHLHP